MDTSLGPTLTDVFLSMIKMKLSDYVSNIVSYKWHAKDIIIFIETSMFWTPFISLTVKFRMRKRSVLIYFFRYQTDETIECD